VSKGMLLYTKGGRSSKRGHRLPIRGLLFQIAMQIKVLESRTTFDDELRSACEISAANGSMLS
jgi:hypothetical protein